MAEKNNLIIQNGWIYSAKKIRNSNSNIELENVMKKIFNIKTK